MKEATPEQIVEFLTSSSTNKTDIVGRLRAYARNASLGVDVEDYLTWQAADEIERLTDALATCRELRKYAADEIEKLRADLDKFRAVAELWKDKTRRALREQKAENTQHPLLRGPSYLIEGIGPIPLIGKGYECTIREGS